MPRIPGKPAVTATTPDDVVVPDLNPTGLSTESAIAMAVTIPDEPEIVVPDIDGAQNTQFGSHLVSVAAITASPDNPRADLELDEEFVASIAEHGILQPLLVTADPMVDGELAQSYTLIAGHRRLAAAEQLGWRAVPVVVRETGQATVGVGSEVLRLVENLQRRDLSPVDEAHAYERLVKVHGLSQADVAAQVGRNQGHVSKRLKMLTIGSLGLGMVVDGRLSLDEAVSLARMPAGVRADILDGVDRGLAAEGLIDNATLKLADLAERGAVLKQLKKDGVPFADLAAGGEIPEGAQQHHVGGHDDCPNRFVVVEEHKVWGMGASRTWTSEYCTDEAAHRVAAETARLERKSEIDAADADGVREPQWLINQRLADARRERLEGITAARSTVVVAMLAGKLPKAASEFIAQATIAAAQWAHGGGEIIVNDPPQEWLDVVIPGIAEGAVWAAAHGDVALRLALATWCATAEFELSELVEAADRGDDDREHLCLPLAELYAQRLTSSGHVLSPLEQTALGIPIAEELKSDAAAAE